MIDVTFSRMGRSAVIGGIGQYDTGQRLRMHGLPSPQEFTEKDDLLSGDLVTVQVHFGYRGDTQAEMRLATWDEDRAVWLVDVPDEYTTRYETVYVYVYVYFGTDGESERASTMYSAAFMPISRPAPSDVVTDAQLAEWERLSKEIDVVLASLSTAMADLEDVTEGADAAAVDARQDAANANLAAKTAADALAQLKDAGEDIGKASMETVDLAAGSDATAARSGDTTTLGIPRGLDGPKGETGDTGPADIEIAFDDETGTLTITTKV